MVTEIIKIADEIKANPNLEVWDKDALLIALIDKVMEQK